MHAVCVCETNKQIQLKKQQADTSCQDREDGLEESPNLFDLPVAPLTKPDILLFNTTSLFNHPAEQAANPDH